MVDFILMKNYFCEHKRHMAIRPTHTAMKKYLTTLVLALAAITSTAQNDAGMKAQDASILESGIDSVPPRAFFDTGHVILAYVMCPTHSNTPRLFDPQMPAFWVGSMTLRDGIMGHKADGVPTKKGFLRQNEAGVTLLQLSKGLSRDIFGATTALQVGMGTIGLDRNYEATREDGKIQFVEAEEKLSSSSIKYLTLKVPVLLGVQDRMHRFSLLSGVSLDLCIPGRDLYYYGHQNDDKKHHWRIHANCFSANWQVMAGIGPLTISYTQSLIPLFELNDGTSIYPNSLCLGLDLWYLMRR